MGSWGHTNTAHRLTRVAIALALAQRIAIAPHCGRRDRIEHLQRVSKAIRRTRPGR